MSENNQQREGPWTQRPELLGRPSQSKRISTRVVQVAFDSKYGSENWRFDPNNQGIGHVETFVSEVGPEEQ